MPGGIEEYRESRQRPEALAGRRRDDAGSRSRIESGDMKEAPDPNAGMSDAEPNIVSGGGASSPGTAGSIGCSPSCLGSAGATSSWRDGNSPV